MHFANTDLSADVDQADATIVIPLDNFGRVLEVGDSHLEGHLCGPLHEKLHRTMNRSSPTSPHRDKSPEEGCVQLVVHGTARPHTLHIDIAELQDCQIRLPPVQRALNPHGGAGTWLREKVLCLGLATHRHMSLKQDMNYETVYVLSLDGPSRRLVYH